MGVKKVNIATLPKEKLEELKPLLQAQAEYVAIGQSVYELYPTPATKLLKVLSDIIGLIQKVQDKKKAIAETLNLGDEEKRAFMQVTITDLISDEENIQTIKGILNELLDGVDTEDFEQMTTGQLISLINKIVKVNINTLPPSVKDKLFNVSKQVGIQVEANQGNLQPHT
jgi:hypothetical protein